jgi:hypothetical protein
MKDFKIFRNDIQILRNEIQAAWNKFQIRRNEIQIQNPPFPSPKRAFSRDYADADAAGSRCSFDSGSSSVFGLRFGVRRSIEQVKGWRRF